MIPVSKTRSGTIMKIKKNKVRCKKCNEILESIDPQDYQWCRCGAISIDGGTKELKRTGLPENIEELSETEA